MNDATEPRSWTLEDGCPAAELRDGRVLLTGWPEPRAEWHPARGPREICRPAFRVVYPAGQAPHPALDRFRATLPEEVAAQVTPFATHQWNLLELMAARAEAVQLAAHNPVLTYCLANNDHFRKNLTKPPAYLAQWRMDLTQARLLEWLGFPARTACVKLFRRIDPAPFTLGTARLLRIALNTDPALLGSLAHLRHIHRGVLSLVLAPKCKPGSRPRCLTKCPAAPMARWRTIPANACSPC